MVKFTGIGIPLLYLVLSFILLCLVENVLSGITSSFIRSEFPSTDIPLDSPVFAVPEGYNPPQQVHITQGDYDGKAVIVSWVTMIEPGSSEVFYGTSNTYDLVAYGTVTQYTYYTYTSGYIHHCVLRDLEYSTKYNYKIGAGNSTREFWFETPPALDPDASYTFGIIGDLGQTYNSLSTLDHYMSTGGQTVLFVGDLSYADLYQDNDGERWDSWGRLIERSVAYQPWIWTTGNHDIEYNPNLGEFSTFKTYLHRYATPHRASNSSSPLWYAVRRASAHIIVLSSYSPFVMYTPQWFWLWNELKQVDREKTPWLIVIMHSPLYNSNNAHHMEGESMRSAFERWFADYKVDIVFSGHVHAYERSHRVSNINYNITTGYCYPVRNKTAPVYITVGDGGNREGLASGFITPQPKYSAYREASYGHAILELKNRTHAFYHWIRNDDGKRVPTDHHVFRNLYWASNPGRRLKKNQPNRHISLAATY